MKMKWSYVSIIYEESNYGIKVSLYSKFELLSKFPYICNAILFFKKKFSLILSWSYECAKKKSFDLNG